MNDLLGLMASSPYDITGITDSLQIRYHIQSYMMHFKNGSLNSDALRSFWLEVRSQDEKMDVIQAYELGLTSKAQSNGFYVGAIFPWNLVTDYWENPSIHGANRLLELGMPFVKREVIRSLSKKELSQIKSKIGNLYSLGVNDIEEFFTN
jgi:lipopolysaccharide biosynthesis protein